MTYDLQLGPLRWQPLTYTVAHKPSPQAYFPKAASSFLLIMTGEEALSTMRLLLDQDDADASMMTSIPVLICLNSKAQRIPLPPRFRDIVSSITDGSMQRAEEKEISTLFSQAVASHESGDWIQALQGFSHVLDQCPSHADAAFNIAAILQLLGNTRLAVYYTTLVSKSVNKTIVCHGGEACSHVGHYIFICIHTGFEGTS